ncbi:MAG: hypothetical protein ACK2T6_05055 [Anaerolineae bacterium]
MARHQVAPTAWRFRTLLPLWVVAIALGTLAGAISVAAQVPDPTTPPETRPLYAPLLLRGNAATEPATSPVLTPSPTPPSSSPSPTPSSTPTSESTSRPPGDHGPVLFQLATYGGLSADLYLAWKPSETPWLTVYEDGTYIRIHSEFSEDDGSYERWFLTGQLSQDQTEAIIARLIDDIEFFDLPERPPDMICVTDGPTDHVYVSFGDRAHRMHVYGLTSYSSGRFPCPTPWPIDDRLIELAGLVDTLQEQLTESEQPYEVKVGTLLAAEDSWMQAAPLWPFPSITLAPKPGDWITEIELQDDLARDVMRAIDENRAYGSYLARFTENELIYVVGFRVEFPGWSSYK